MVKTLVKRWLHCSNGATNNHDTAPGSVSEILWVLPCHSVASADRTRVSAVLLDKECKQGISFIHDMLITEPRAIVGWKQGADRRFILCTLRGCTPLGCGFYRVRLLVDKEIRLDPEDVEAMRQVLEEYTPRSEA
jgi:hypothetical protein